MSSEQIKQLTQLYQSGVLTKEAYEAAIANLQPTSQPSDADLIAGLGQTGGAAEVPPAGDMLGSTRHEPDLANAVPDVSLDDDVLGVHPLMRECGDAAGMLLFEVCTTV